MTLNDYIESIKSVDMAGRTPIEVYEELLAIKSEYYWDTDDSCLDEHYCETNSETVDEYAREILKEGGWKEVWKYLHNIPEESLNDSCFGVEHSQLRPINWSDVAELQRCMIQTLQSKLTQFPDKDHLNMALSTLIDTANEIKNLINKEESK